MSTISRPRVPEGLRDVMKDLTREILKDKPTDIYEFAENYFQSRLPQKENYTVKDFEPTSKKYDFSYIKNPQRYQVPVALVYSIIPEGLTNLIKDLIKAVLREQPENLCDFAVEYFRHLKAASQTEMAKEISYTAYENYFINKERFLFTPYVKCTCGRTFGEGFGSGYQLEQLSSLNHVHHNDSVYRPETIATNLEDTNNNNVKDVLQNDTIYSEKYLNSIYVIQRYVRRYLKRKSTTTTKHNSNSSYSNLSTLQNTLMSEETAAIITQRTLRNVFGSGRESAQQFDSSSDKIPVVPQLHLNHNENDNISEAASYTSASTALLSASESGREASEPSTAENIFRNTILEGEEIANDHENISNILNQSQMVQKDDLAQINDANMDDNAGTMQPKESETIVLNNEETESLGKKHADPNMSSSLNSDFKKDDLKENNENNKNWNDEDEKVKEKNKIKKSTKEEHDNNTIYMELGNPDNDHIKTIEYKQHIGNVLDDSSLELDSIGKVSTEIDQFKEDKPNPQVNNIKQDQDKGDELEIQESLTNTKLNNQDLTKSLENKSKSLKEDTIPEVQEKEEKINQNSNVTLESPEHETLDDETHKIIIKLNQDIIQCCDEIQRKNSTEIHEHGKESFEKDKSLKNEANFIKIGEDLKKTPDENEKELKLDNLKDNETTTENRNNTGIIEQSTFTRLDNKENNSTNDTIKKGNEFKHEKESEEHIFDTITKAERKEVDENIATRIEQKNTSVGESKTDDIKSFDELNEMKSKMIKDEHGNELINNNKLDNGEENAAAKFENKSKQSRTNEDKIAEATDNIPITQEDLNSIKCETQNQSNDQEPEEKIELPNENDSTTDNEKSLPTSDDRGSENSNVNKNNDHNINEDADVLKNINEETEIKQEKSRSLQNLSQKSADIESNENTDNKEFEKDLAKTKHKESLAEPDNEANIMTELTDDINKTIGDNLLENKPKPVNDDSNSETTQNRNKREAESSATEIEHHEDISTDKETSINETGKHKHKLNSEETNENHDEIRNHELDPEQEQTNKFITNQPENYSIKIEPPHGKKEIDESIDEESKTDIADEKETTNSDEQQKKINEETAEDAIKTGETQKDVNKTEIISEKSLSDLNNKEHNLIAKEYAKDILEQAIDNPNYDDTPKTETTSCIETEAKLKNIIEFTIKDQDELGKLKRGDTDYQDKNSSTELDKNEDILTGKDMTEDEVDPNTEKHTDELTLNVSHTVLNSVEIPQEQKFETQESNIHLNQSGNHDSNEDKSDENNTQNAKVMENDLTATNILKIEGVKQEDILEIQNSNKQHIDNVTNDTISSASALAKNEEQDNILISKTHLSNPESRIGKQDTQNDESVSNEFKENTLQECELEMQEQELLNKSIMNETNEDIIDKHDKPFENINDMNETSVLKRDGVKLETQGSIQQLNKSIVNNSDKIPDIESEKPDTRNNESIVNESIDQTEMKKIELQQDDRININEKISHSEQTVLTGQELNTDDNKIANNNNKVLVLGNGDEEQDTQSDPSIVNEWKEKTELKSEDLQQYDNKIVNNNNEVSVLVGEKLDKPINASTINETKEPTKLTTIVQDEPTVDKRDGEESKVNPNLGVTEQMQSNQDNTNSLQKDGISNDSEKIADDYQKSPQSSYNELNNDIPLDKLTVDDSQGSDTLDTPSSKSIGNESKKQSEESEQDNKNIEINDKISDSKFNNDSLTKVNKYESTEVKKDAEKSFLDNQSEMIIDQEQDKYKEDNIDGRQKRDLSNDSQKDPDGNENILHNLHNQIKNDTTTDDSLGSQELDTHSSKSILNDLKRQTESKSETIEPDNSKIENNDNISELDCNSDKLTKINKDEANEIKRDIEESVLNNQNEVTSHLIVEDKAESNKDNTDNFENNDLLNESNTKTDISKDSTENIISSDKLTVEDSEYNENKNHKSQHKISSDPSETNDGTNDVIKLDHNNSDRTSIQSSAIGDAGNDVKDKIENTTEIDSGRKEQEESNKDNVDNLQKNDLLNKSKNNHDINKDSIENITSSQKLTVEDSENNEKTENRDHQSEHKISSGHSKAIYGAPKTDVEGEIKLEHINSDLTSLQKSATDDSGNDVKDKIKNKTETHLDNKEKADSNQGNVGNQKNNDLLNKNEPYTNNDNTENITSSDKLAIEDSENNEKIKNKDHQSKHKISSDPSKTNDDAPKTDVESEIKLEHISSDLTSLQRSATDDSGNDVKDKIENKTEIDRDNKEQAESNKDNIENLPKNDLLNKNKNEPYINNDNTENIVLSDKLTIEDSEKTENKDHKSGHMISSDPSETNNGATKIAVEGETKLEHISSPLTSIQSSAIDGSGNDVKDKEENKTETDSKLVANSILLQDPVKLREEENEATNNYSKLIQESTIIANTEPNNEANKNSENDIDEEMHKILSGRLQLLRTENEENILNKDRTENNVGLSTSKEDEINSMTENFNNEAVEVVENANVNQAKEFNKESLTKSNSEKELFKNDTSNNALEKTPDNSDELNLLQHSHQESSDTTTNDQDEELSQQNRMKRSLEEKIITENILDIENLDKVEKVKMEEQRSPLISTENTENISNEKLNTEEAKNQDENLTNANNESSSKSSVQDNIDIGSDLVNRKSINDQETTLHNIGNKSPETIIGNQNLNIGRSRNYNEGLIGSFSGQRFAETHLKSFWKEHQMNNESPIGQYIEFGENGKLINNSKLKEDEEIGKDNKDRTNDLDLGIDNNPKLVEEAFIIIDKQNLNESQNSNLPQSATFKESNEESTILAENGNNQNILEIIDNANATDDGTNSSIKTFERIPRYFLGVTPTTDKENLLAKRKTCKEPTSFTVPFDKSTDSKFAVKSSMPKNTHADFSSDEEQKVISKEDKIDNAKKINLENCANVEEPLLNSETPTKLFKELNEFEYDETHDIDMEITYTIDEILRLKTEHDSEQNSDENEDNNDIDIIEYTPMIIRLTSETNHQQKSDETDENILECSEFSETPESMLHTIIELSESETPRPDSKILCADQLQPSDEDYLNNLEKISDSTNTSWTTGSKEDNSFVSDEFLDDENYNIDKTIDKGDSKHKTEGGIYEYSNEVDISQEVELKNDNYEKLVKTAPSPPNDDPYFEDLKETAAEKIQRCYRKYIIRKREISPEDNDYSDEIINARKTFILAVCTIQRAFRNYLLHKNQEDRISHKSGPISEQSQNDKAAIVIQKAFRQYFEHKVQLKKKPQSIDSKADNTAEEDFGEDFPITDKNNEYYNEINDAQKTLIMAVYTIQKAFRSYQLRKQEKNLNKMLNINLDNHENNKDGKDKVGSIKDSDASNAVSALIHAKDDAFSDETTKSHKDFEAIPTEFKQTPDQSQNTAAAIVIQKAFRQYLDHKSKSKSEDISSEDLNKKSQEDIENVKMDMTQIDKKQENYEMEHPNRDLLTKTEQNSTDNMDIVIENLNQDNLHSTNYQKEKLENIKDNDNLLIQPKESSIVETTKIIENFSKVDRINENFTDNSSQNETITSEIHEDPITVGHKQNLTSITNEQILEYNNLIGEFINSERQYSDVVNQHDQANQLLRAIEFQTPDINKITRVIDEFVDSQKEKSDSMVLSREKLEEPYINKSLAKSVLTGKDEINPNEFLPYEAEELISINNDKFENLNNSKILLSELHKDSNDSSDVIIEKFNRRENDIQNLREKDKLENLNINKNVTVETYNSSTNDDEFPNSNNSTILLKEDSNESADVVIEKFNQPELNSGNIAKGFNTLRADEELKQLETYNDPNGESSDYDIEKIEDIKNYNHNNLKAEIIRDNLTKNRLTAKNIEEENPNNSNILLNEINGEVNESTDVIVEKFNQNELNSENLSKGFENLNTNDNLENLNINNNLIVETKEILNEVLKNVIPDNVNIGNIADNITLNKTDENSNENIDSASEKFNHPKLNSENIAQGLESLTAKDEYENIKIYKNTNVESNDNFNIDLENLNIDNNLTDETKEKMNKYVENNTEHFNHENVENNIVINKLTENHKSQENIENPNNKNVETIDNYDSKEQNSVIVEIINDKFTRNQTSINNEYVEDMENNSKSLRSSGSSKELAAAIIQKAFRSYLANKNEISTLSYLNNEAIYFEPTAPTEDDLISSSPSSTLDSMNSSQLCEERAARILQKALRKFIERKPKSNSINDATNAAISTKSNWFVGDEPIIAKESLSRTSSQISFDETEAYVELKDNSHYLVDSSSNLEKSDANNLSRSPTAPVSSRINNVVLNNDKQTNFSGEIVSVVGTGIKAMQLMQKDQGNSDVLKEDTAEQVANDEKSLKEAQNVSPLSDNNDEPLVALHQENLASNKKGKAIQYNNLIGQFINSERQYSESVNQLNPSFQEIEFKTPDVYEITKILTEFVNSQNAFNDSTIPYEKLEEPCIKRTVSKSLITTDSKDEAIGDEDVSTSSDIDNDTEDSLSTKTVKLQGPEMAIEKMQQRRDSTTKISSLDNPKEYNFDEPLVGPIDNLDTDEEGIVVNKLQREETRESSAQSDVDVVICGDNEGTLNFFENIDFDTNFPAKGSLKRVHTIAGDVDAKALLKNVTIDEAIKYIEPPDYELNSGSLCLDDDTSENIRRKMMAYSLSETDSDYFDKTLNNTSNSIDVKSPKYDDFNVSTALLDNGDTSTETESTIVSAVTKLQAGARGYLTRKRLGRTSLTSDYKSLPQDETSKASFGNAAISESLEHLVQEAAAKRIQKVYRKHYRQKLADMNQPDDSISPELTTSMESSLAQKRSIMLQRGDALRNNSTPDEGNSSSNGSDNGKYRDDQKEKLKSAEESITLSSSNESKSSDELQLKVDENNILSPVKTSTAAVRAKKIEENKIRWLAMRQNSMPVQIDSEVLRVIPKHMRKKIKSADGEKKKGRRRVLKD